MGTVKKAFIALLITAFAYTSFFAIGGSVLAADTGPTAAHEAESSYGPLFYVGLGAVAVIATFAIWQNVKDKDKEKAETDVKEAEEKEIEDFDEYFKDMEGSEE